MTQSSSSVAPVNNGLDFGKSTELPPHAAGNFVVLEDKVLGKGAYAEVKIGLRKEDIKRAEAGERGTEPLEDGLDSVVAVSSVAIKCIDTLSLKLRDRKALTDEVRAIIPLLYMYLIYLYRTDPNYAGIGPSTHRENDGGHSWSRRHVLLDHGESERRGIV